MNDLISRQAAIDAVMNHQKAVLESYPYDSITADIYEMAHRHIANIIAILPPVNRYDRTYEQGWRDGQEALKKEIWENGRDRLD